MSTRTAARRRPDGSHTTPVAKVKAERARAAAARASRRRRQGILLYLSLIHI